MIPTIALTAAFGLMPYQDPRPVVDLRLRVTAVTGRELWARRLCSGGMSEWNAGRPREAVAACTATLLLHPDRLYALVFRGKALAALGRHDEAADVYARVIALGPTDWEHWWLAGGGWLDRGRHDEARQCFERAAELAPPGKLRSQARLREAASWLGSKCGDVTTTLTGSRTQCDINPTGARDLPAERQVRAEFALTQAIAEATDEAPTTRASAYYCRGAVRHGMYHFAAAVEDYDAAIALDPTCGHYQYWRGQVAFLMNDPVAAVIHLDAADRLFGPCCGSQHVRATIHLQKGEHEKAAAAAAEAARLDPADSSALVTHGVALWLCGRKDEADRVTERLAELGKCPRASVLYQQYCLLCGGLDRMQDGERLLGDALERWGLAPEECAFIHSLRANHRSMSADRMADAFEDMTCAVRLAPTVEGFRRLRARAAAYLGRERAAMEDAAAVLRLNPFASDVQAELRAARGAEEMRAGVAGREPDFRPAGPIERVPISGACRPEVLRRQPPPVAPAHRPLSPEKLQEAMMTSQQRDVQQHLKAISDAAGKQQAANGSWTR